MECSLNVDDIEFATPKWIENEEEVLIAIKV